MIRLTSSPLFADSMDPFESVCLSFARSFYQPLLLTSPQGGIQSQHRYDRADEQISHSNPNSKVGDISGEICTVLSRSLLQLTYVFWEIICHS